MRESSESDSDLGAILTALRRAHGSLLDALEFADDGYVFSLDGVLVCANSAMARMLGIDDPTLLRGRPLAALQSHTDTDTALDRAREAARSARPLGTRTYTIERPDGSEIMVEASSLPFVLGDVTLVLSTARDITQRERTRIELERSERSLRDSQRIAGVGSWVLDLATNELWWSSETYRIFEIDPERFGATYEAFVDVIHPEDREAVDAAYRKSLEDRTPYAISHRLRMADGRVKHVVERCETQYDDAGEPVRSLGTVQDVTERVLQEQRLRRERNFSSAVLENVGGLVVVLDREGRVRGFNRAAEQLSGLRFEDVEGKCPWDTFLPPDVAERVRSEAFESLIQDPDARSGHYVNEWLAVDGQRPLIEWSNVLLRDDSGAVEFVVALGIDITERQATEDYVMAQLAEKEVLLKEIHHRVKNNLQVISSLLYLQATQADDPRVSPILAESRQRVRAMALVHETLYQSGDLAHVEPRRYIDKLVVGVRMTHRERASSIDIELDIEPTPLELEAAIPCGLIVNELLTNAFKHAFTGRARGKVRVTLTATDGHHRLTVSDDGIGLPPPSEGGPGTLGIELVRALTSQLGGTLEIARTNGSCFTITFPSKGAAESERHDT